MSDSAGWSRPIVWLLGFVLWGTCAGAGVNLHFTPADTTVAVGGSGRLAVVVDDTISIRTFEVTVGYDPAVVGSLGGAAGSLFTGSGLMLFKGFQELVPGTWYGYVVIMGAGLAVTGPGELFTWDFEGLAEGLTSISLAPVLPDTIGVYLADVSGDWYQDIRIDPTSICVGACLSEAAPPAPTPELKIWPNPFNAGVSIRLTAPGGGRALCGIFDAGGRRVRTLEGWVDPAGTCVLTWNGRDESGTRASSGVYLFELVTDSGTTTGRGVLLK